ncbi:retinol dehydrogenase [Novosphingobium endophyticum]|uniref:Retinol dehydrogenase n=1 Tax=Novosphingobium endophyticum TaxID=1955250 RepID=A0A916TS79_9SPHN|nr:SDR family NAD(P)-dependent oxidoreductase [Novosphingobium endophyticum]GGC01014.1 retinol dehydrogenase [Novosphingobium endophyticum]
MSATGADTAKAVGSGRVAVVTGASSGIGHAVAKALASQGWQIIGVGRDPQRTEESGDDIRQCSPDGARVQMLRADLSSMRETSELADRIANLTGRIDLLVNNAGGMTDRLELTSEGIEASFASNHLGPFLLTDRLLPLIRKTAEQAPSGAVRILMTSSGASEAAPPMDFDDMQGLRNFQPGLAYCSVKLANMLFTRALAARLEGTGIVAHAAAPGPVASRFFDYAPKETLEHVRDLPKLTEAQGADTLIWLATAEEPGRSTGGYWQNRAPRKPHSQADDPDAVARFWSESRKLIITTGV